MIPGTETPQFNPAASERNQQDSPRNEGLISMTCPRGRSFCSDKGHEQDRGVGFHIGGGNATWSSPFST